MTKKKFILTIVFMLIVILSVTVVSKVTTSQEVHASAIQTLNEKRMIVIELTAATAATSMAVAAIPGDMTTPISNQIAGLSSYLLIVACAIFLEKLLLTSTCFISFTFLIPIAFLILIFCLYKDIPSLRLFAAKLIAFSIAICAIVPASVQLSNLVDKTCDTQAVFEAAKSSSDEIENANKDIAEEPSNKFTGFLKDIKDSVTGGIKNAINKAEIALSNFIDAISALIVTSCLIPIGVIFLFLWAIKLTFGIDFKLPKNASKKNDKKTSTPPQKVLIES